MKTLQAIFGVCLTALVAACDTPTQTYPTADERAAEFRKEFNAKRGITDKTHGTFTAIKAFTSADVPQRLPVRNSPWDGNGVTLLVGHSLGHSVVSIMYPVNVQNTYSTAGRGAAVPVQVRVDDTADAEALYPRTGFRRVQTSRSYTFKGRIYSDNNRAEIMNLTSEVLAKTHCRGGIITQDASKGDVAQAFGRRSKAVGGGSFAPGWVVSYRCSRWRAK